MSDPALTHADQPPTASEGAGTARVPLGAWLSLIAVTLGITAVQIDGTAVAAANAAIATDLAATPRQIYWVTTGYLLALSALLVPAGTVADRIGRKKAFLIGAFGLSLASLLCGMSGSVEMLIGARIAQAVFASLLGAAGLAVLKETFPPRRLPAALGIFGAVTAVAMAGGPLIGGVLVEYASWPWVFYLNLPLGILGALLGGTAVKQSARQRSGPLDLPGALTLTAAMVSTVWGITGAQDGGWSSGRTLGSVSLGVVLLAVFVLIEARTERPMVARGLSKDRSVPVGLLLTIVTTFVFFAIIFHLMSYFQSVQGKSAVTAAVGLLPLTAAVALASPLAGWVMEQLGLKGTLILGPVLFLGALVLFLRIDADTCGWQLVTPLVLTGLGAGFLLVAATRTIVGNAPVARAGAVSGIQQSMQQLGGTLGVALVGSLLGSSVNANFPAALRDELDGQGRSAAALAGNDSVRESVALGFPPSARDTVEEQLSTTARQKGEAMSTDRLDHLADTVTRVAHHTFIDGMHLVFTVSAVTAVLAGLLALLVRDTEPQCEQPAATPEAGLGI
ncbi:MFS transporter [Streptomyces sp. 8N114]|uniref:MFS transporter n=1 Tax=Streptomyces sp. 8N114 TaxID=3457419 RepID=UPI003FD05126